jgi:hypothetical protein
MNYLSRCPALECESSFGLSELDAEAEPEFAEVLSRVTWPTDLYVFFCCDGWCHRIWRMQPRQAPEWRYHEPQWIGSWDRATEIRPVLWQQSTRIELHWTACRSRRDPSRPAMSKTDAYRR